MIKLTASGVPTTTEQEYTYEIVERLCKPYCINNEYQPIVTTGFSVINQEVVNGQVYATVQCIIDVTYQPKGRNCPCSYRKNTFIETVQISAPGVAISVADSNGFNEPAYVNANNCNLAQGIRTVGVLSATITTA